MRNNVPNVVYHTLIQGSMHYGLWPILKSIQLKYQKSLEMLFHLCYYLLCNCNYYRGFPSFSLKGQKKHDNCSHNNSAYNLPVSHLRCTSPIRQAFRTFRCHLRRCRHLFNTLKGCNLGRKACKNDKMGRACICCAHSCPQPSARKPRITA